MIVSFASSKGGVGKSTACAAIGAGLAQCGQKVLILDLDQNQTVGRWGRKRKQKIPGLTVKAVERDSFTTIFRETVAAGTFDHILIMRWRQQSVREWSPLTTFCGSERKRTRFEFLKLRAKWSYCAVICSVIGR